MKIKRVKTEVECESCGRNFTQTRWWQVFCCRQCKKKAEKASLSEVRTLRMKVKDLRKQIEMTKDNVLVHSGKAVTFRYDEENQEVKE
jgi:ribosomal protein L37AE/L43A